ncbi:MAG TPA: hypothetical protein VME01_00645 [Solirubrobacteraceae bacterium]|nr:hypothetical protein [Solirubrobacteraceae bacterium]
MSRAKLAVTASVMAMLLSACGIAAKPQAGTPQLKKSTTKGFYGLVDDPRKLRVKCLKADRIRFHEYLATSERLPAIQVGKLPSGPTIIFEPTAGVAQGIQMEGNAQGAEVIGAALLYPNGAGNNLLNKVEACTAVGVTG